MILKKHQQLTKYHYSSHIVGIVEPYPFSSINANNRHTHLFTRIFYKTSDNDGIIVDL